MTRGRLIWSVIQTLVTSKAVQAHKRGGLSERGLPQRVLMYTSPWPNIPTMYMTSLCSLQHGGRVRSRRECDNMRSKEVFVRRNLHHMQPHMLEWHISLEFTHCTQLISTQGPLCIHCTGATSCVLYRGHFMCTAQGPLHVYCTGATSCVLYRGHLMYTAQGPLHVYCTGATSCTLHRGHFMCTVQGPLHVRYTGATSCVLYRGHFMYTVQGPLHVYCTGATSCTLYRDDSTQRSSLHRGHSMSKGDT